MTTEQLNEFRAFAIFNNNGHPNGFENSILTGNKIETAFQPSGNLQFVFYNYDYKNQIEMLSSKNNSPLKFADCYCFNSEHKLYSGSFDFFSESKIISSPGIAVSSVISKDMYIDQVKQLKNQIQQGEIYEINYCITFEAHNAEINPFSIYHQLNRISQAPFSALIKLDDKYIICSSPELYLSKRGRQLFTKPIKGTARRSDSPDEDAKIMQDLHSNLKERTENVMIVDVARNDLSKIAKKESVKVEKIFAIESYQQVHQMVSTISCELKENIRLNDIIHATFPMASMTGAPKIRAMQLIDKFEIYNRGPFSGSIGYVHPNGDFDLNVLIRSIFYNATEKYLSFSVGSAITHLCDPEKEYEECMLKASALLKALQN